MRRPLQALGFIRHIYAIEHRIRDIPPEARLAARHTESVPVLDALCAWAVELGPQVVPSSPLGEALAYLDGTSTGQPSN